MTKDKPMAGIKIAGNLVQVTLFAKAKFRELEVFFGFEAGVPDAHDKMRVKNFLAKHPASYIGGYPTEHALNDAMLMASKIKTADKAFRRGVAFRNALIVFWPVFIVRAIEILGLTVEDIS